MLHLEKLMCTDDTIDVEYTVKLSALWAPPLTGRAADCLNTR